MSTLEKDDLLSIDGIGDVMADSYIRFFSDPAKQIYRCRYCEERYTAGDTERRYR